MRRGRILGVFLAAPTRDRVAHDVFGVDRGRCVLRTPDRPIGLDGDAPGSGPRVDQVERDVRTGIGEQSCALADDEGIGEQVELVDQALAGSQRTRAPVPGTRNVPAWWAFRSPTAVAASPVRTGLPAPCAAARPGETKY